MKNLLLLLILTSFCKSCKSKNDKNVENIENQRFERIISYRKNIDSINKSLEWKETTFGLWKSKNGDLGLKTVEATDTNLHALYNV